MNWGNGMEDKYYRANQHRPTDSNTNQQKTVGDDLISLSKTAFIAFIILGAVIGAIAVVNHVDFLTVLICFLLWFLILEVIKGVLLNLGQMSNDIHKIAGEKEERKE